MAECNFDFGFDFDDNLSEKTVPSKHRAINKENTSKDVDDFLDLNASKNTKKANNQFLTLYNDTMEVLKVQTGNEIYKPLDETTIDELPNALSKFFMVAVKKDGKTYNASSLNQFYQVAVRFLKEKYHTPVDIKEDLRFKKVYEVVKAKCAQAVEMGARPGMNASKAVDPNLIRLAFQKGKLGRGNPRSLVSTVHFNLMTGFGCRANQVHDI